MARAFCVALLLTVCAASASAQPPAPRQRPVDRVGKAPAPGTTKKIVGGKPAPPGKYPFQVALIASGTAVGSEHFGQFCGGALIDKMWVLTAAHCVPETKPEEVDVYIGSSVLPSGQGGAAPAGRREHVTKIISHQKYDDSTSDNDIALLKLAAAVPESFAVPAIPATAAHEKTHAGLGAALTVIGWGATSEGGDTTPQLMEVNVNVQSSATCEANYRDVVPSSRITENMFCAGVPKGGKDSCQGDSGGFIGAALPSSSGNTSTNGGAKPHVSLGIVSWGIGCAQPDLFGVYTRVSRYTGWLAEMMKS